MLINIDRLDHAVHDTDTSKKTVQNKQHVIQKCN